MPYTLNGVGTHYYGAKNKSTIQGTCRHCGRHAKLSYYDTREWFCVVFIPLIPLRRYHIEAQCSTCTKHLRVPLAKYESALSDALGPVRAALDRSPSDANAHVRFVETLISFGRLADAEKALQDALRTAPSHSRLNFLAAQLASQRGDMAAAKPFFERAAGSAPQDAEVRLAFGRHLATCSDWDGAARELTEALRLHPGDPATLYLLGDCHARAERWPQALQVFEQALARQSSPTADKELLRRIAECKKKIGIPLTDPERKSSRRWFGISRRSTAPGVSRASGLSGARVALILAIVVGVGVVGALGYGWWQQNHVDVYFDNGLKTKVTITLDGTDFAVLPGPPVRRALRSGPHTVVVKSKTAEIERADVTIDRLPLLEAIFDDRFYVYNVAEAHIYHREVFGYAKEARERSYDESLLALQRFFPQTGVHYVFRRAPDSIQVDSRATRERRVAFNVATGIDFNRLAVIRYADGKKPEAEQALRKALDFEPCQRTARKNLVHLYLAEGRADQAVRSAREWIDNCPQTSIDGHRTYQDAMGSVGRRAEALVEYRARLAAHPDAGVNHYLFGRLIADPEQSLVEQREALRLDPNLMWAHVASAHDLMALERYPEAAMEMERALALPEHDPTTAVPFAHARVGAGTAAGAESTLSAFSDKDSVQQVNDARWLLALAAQRWDLAEKLVQARTQAEGEWGDAWLWRAQLLVLRNGPQAPRTLIEKAQSRKELRDEAARLRFEMLLDTGEYKQAAELAVKEGARPNSQFPVLHRVYAAAGLMLAGDRPGAERLLVSIPRAAQRGTEDAGERALAAIVDGLRGLLKADDVVREARRGHYLLLKHAYFMMAVRAEVNGSRRDAQGYFRRSERACVDLAFPLMIARRLAAAS